MTLHTEVLDIWQATESIHDAWLALCRETESLTDGLDATNGPVWTQALAQTFPEGVGMRIVVLKDDDDVVGLLPVVPEPGKPGRLMAASALYGGRNGFLLNTPDTVLLAALLRGLDEVAPGWTAIRLTLVTASPSMKLLAQAAHELGAGTVVEPGWESPCFPLLDDAKAFAKDMSKGLKQTLRTTGNKFATTGTLHYQRLDDDPDIGQRLEDILTIERLSWKHSEGTAITNNPEQERFYRHLFPPARAAGLLSGMVMYLDEQPIAHNFGLLWGPVYCCLKHSNTEPFRALSPAQLLNAQLIEHLRGRGVQTYDFMGRSEPHKLRWSKATRVYSRDAVWLYAPSVAGRSAWVWHRLKHSIREVARRANRSPDAPPMPAPPAGKRESMQP